MKSQKELKSALKHLGKKIYLLRIVKNLTIKEIAPMLSLSPSAYRNIEKGDCDVSFTTLLLLTRILDVDFAELSDAVSAEVI